MIYPWCHFPQYDINFAFMPKVANTSMKQAFSIALGHKRFEKSHLGIHSFTPLLTRQYKDMPVARFDFAFVRHPLDRLVSCYRDKIIDKGGNRSYYCRIVTGKQAYLYTA